MKHHDAWRGGSGGSTLMWVLCAAATAWAALLLYVRAQLDRGNLRLLAWIADVLFSEGAWLPNGLRYRQDYSAFPLISPAGEYYPRPVDACFAISVALLLLAARIAFTRHVAAPVARRFRVSDRKVRPDSHETLEEVYRRAPKPDGKTIRGVAKGSGLSEWYVRSWFRKRRNYDKPSVMVKFSESTFKFIYYFTVFWGGAWALWGKDWYQDTAENHPRINLTTEIHPMEWDVCCYYQLALGFYWSLFLSQFTDTRRKDFWVMFLHHAVTITLLTVSYSSGWHRIGMIICVTHDLSDWTLELSKSLVYLRCDWAVRGCLVVLLVGWVGSRLIYYPLYVLPMAAVEHLRLYERPILYYYLCVPMLALLVPLHLMWFYYLCRTIYETLRYGDVHDSRSDSDESPAEQNESAQEKNESLLSGGVDGTRRRVQHQQGEEVQRGDAGDDTLTSRNPDNGRNSVDHGHINDCNDNYRKLLCDGQLG